MSFRSYAGVYEGPITDQAYNQLLADVEAKRRELAGKVAEAQAVGVNTDYAKVTQTTLSLFKDEFIPWDRANPAQYYTTPRDRLDPVYRRYRSKVGFVFDELADCLEIADAAIAELQAQIDGEIVLSDPPDFSKGTLALNGTHYELDGRKVIPSRFFWQPENREDIWQAYGRMGGAYYGLHPHLASADTVSSWHLEHRLIPDIVNLAANNVGPVEFWHGTVINAPEHWIPVNHPEVVTVGRRFFNHYDIDHPSVRIWLEKLFSDVLGPAVAASESRGGLRAHLLNNEPRFPIRQRNNDAGNNVSVHTYVKFATWLEDHYSTIANLNAAYGASYPDFDTASKANYVVNDGVSETLQGSPIWYDWCRFNMDRVNDWFVFLNDRVKAVDPHGHTQIKIWGGGSIHVDYQDQGIDYEFLTKLVDLPGSDSQVIPLNPDHDSLTTDEGWKNCYMLDWRQQSIMMDFIKSISPDKPYEDAEWHGIDGGRWAKFHMERDYLRAALWLAATHGLSSINAWFWNRDEDGSGARRSANQVFHGTAAVQPIVMDTFGRTLKEINAHAEVFASLAPAKRNFVVYYSSDSAIQDRSYSGDMSEVYEALKLLNVPVGFTTPSELTRMTDPAQTLIVPRTPFISDRDLARLQSFEAGGGTIVLVDAADSFTKTERGADRDGGSGLNPNAAIDHGQVFALADSLRDVLADRTPELPVITEIQDEGGESAFGVLGSQSYDAVSGRHMVSLINVSQEQRNVSLQLEEGEPLTVQNLISGNLEISVIELAPQDVLLLSVSDEVGAWESYVAKYSLSSGPTGDKDQDGQSDLLEFAFGGNPSDSSIQGRKPTLRIESGVLTFTNLELNALNPGISYIAEWTEDLKKGPWNSVWDSTSPQPSEDPDYSLVDRSIQLGDRKRLFVRLKISRI